MNIPTIILNNGLVIPSIGFGTWKLKDEKSKLIVEYALKSNITLIDTALIYGNQKEIGSVMKNHPRNTITITSKIWKDDLSYTGVKQQINQILDELETTYIDICLIHWPNSNFPLKETFQALEEFYNNGYIKAVGVSNFTINHLKDCFEVTEIPITINQVEYHPYFFDDELLNFCKKNNIVVQAYCPLAHGNIKDDKTLTQIGKKYNKNEFQIALRWCIDKGVLPIQKTSSQNNLKTNISIFDFKLTPDEIEQINQLNTHKRLVDFAFSEFSY